MDAGNCETSDLNHSSDYLPMVKKVRFQLPERHHKQTYVGWGTRKRMKKMWSTWKKRREISAIFPLKTYKEPDRTVNSCQVTVVMNGVSIAVLIDTGASKSILDIATWRRIAPAGSRMSAADAALRGANGQSLRVFGAIDQTFELQGLNYNQRFQIADTGQALDGLLGLDFLVAVAAKIDLGNMTLAIGKKQIREASCAPETVYAVILREDLECPGYMTVPANCYVCQGETLGDDALVFESLLTDDSDVSLPEVVLNQSEGIISIRVDNRHPEEKKLFAGSVLGYVTPVASSPALERSSTKPWTGDLSRRQRKQPLQTFSFSESQIWNIAELDRTEIVPDSEECDMGYDICTCLLRETGQTSPNGDATVGVGCGNPTPVDLSTRLGEELTSSPAAIVGIDITGREIKFPEVEPYIYACVLGEGEKRTSNPQDCESLIGLAELEGALLKESTQGTSTISGGSQGLVHERGEDPLIEMSITEGEKKVPVHLQCLLPEEGELTTQQLDQLKDLLIEYEDIFIGPNGKVGYTDLVKHYIDTGDAPPKRSVWFRKSFAEKDAIEKEVNHLLKEDKIQLSQSPWASSVVLVKKKDGNLRFCIDYRGLNSVTKKDAYPLPRIDSCLDALTGSKWFSTLDLASGYWQVAMEETSIEKTAFLTHKGLFEWKVMPFGLCNAPATFERLMEIVLGDMQWHKILVYLDDVVAFGSSFEVAYANLREVFHRMRRAHLTLKPSKCALFKKKVEYLGHIVSEKGIRQTQSKIEAIAHWAEPTNLHDLRSFLGITSYYRAFIPNYSEKAEPLTRLLKKDALYEWRKDQQTAFDQLRSDLMKDPVLSYPIRGPENTYILDTDASLFGIGAVLSQLQNGEEKVIAYASRTLSDAQRAYCTTKRELLAVVYFTKHFRQYLAGQKFKLRTDHASLRWLLNFKQTDNMYQRWIAQLADYDMEIEHRPGIKHANADALSRLIRRSCGRPDCPNCGEKEGGILHQVPPGHESPEEPEEPELELSAVILPVKTRRQLKEEQEVTTSKVVPKYNLRPRWKPKSEVSKADADMNWRKRTATPDMGSTTHTEAFPKSTTFESLRRRSKRLQEKRWLPTPDWMPKSKPPTQIENEGVEKPTPTDQESGGEEDRGDDQFETPEVELEEEPEVPVEISIQNWTEGLASDNWVEKQEADVTLKRLRRLLQQNGVRKPNSIALKNEDPLVKNYCKHWASFFFEDGILKRQCPSSDKVDDEWKQILVPDEMRLQLFMRIHAFEAGHTSYDRVYNLLQARFWWWGMSTDVAEWLRACDVCQRNKPGSGKGRYPLTQELATAPMERVAVDIMGPWKATALGNQYILVLQDYFSKWIQIWPLPNHQATTVARALTVDFFSKFGAPLRLHSDQGREFESQLFQEMCTLWGIQKTRTTPYAPWSDGLVERANRTIQGLIKHHVQKSPQQEWDQWLWAVAQTYNTTVHASTGCTPAKLFLTRGEELRLPVDLVYGTKMTVLTGEDCPMSHLEQTRIKIPRLYAHASSHLRRNASIQSSAHAKAGYKLRQYRVGQMVWRYYPPWANEKLGSAWTGPWIVKRQYPNATVQVQLAKSGVGAREGTTLIVHASCLKPVGTTADGKLLQCDYSRVLQYLISDAVPGKKHNEKSLKLTKSQTSLETPNTDYDCKPERDASEEPARDTEL